MSSEKTDAIVLRIIPFSESSVIASMFTKDHGKVSVIAKGAYRPKNPFEGALDLGCVCRVVFIQKSSDVLDVLTEAKLQRRFRAGLRSLQHLYAGYYVIELLRELTEEAQPNDSFFQLALQTLSSIDSDAADKSRLADLIASFELKSLTLLGHAPTIDRCGSCGKEIVAQMKTAFGLIGGGVLCRNCRSGHKQVVVLSKPTIEAMKERIQSQMDNSQSQHKSPVTGEMRGVLSRYMSHHVGKALKMQKMIGDLVSL